MVANVLMHKRKMGLIKFALVCAMVLVINTPESILAAGEYDGVWLGPMTITVPGVGTTTETTGSVFYQEDENKLHFYDFLFGTVELIKSGSQWVLPSPITTTIVFLGIYSSNFNHFS